MSKIKVSELFYSLQGEGRFIGVPSVFLRTYGCNFKCAGFGCKPGELSEEYLTVNPDLYTKFDDLPLVSTGCDSYASWDPRFKNLSPSYSTEELVAMMLKLTPNNRWVQANGNDVHLVITGGEPLLGWQRSYAELLGHPDMQDLRNLTFETNGTQELHEDFRDFLIDWAEERPEREVTFSVSAKLSASGEAWDDAIKPKIVNIYQTYGHTYLKFVVETEEHVAEAIRAVEAYRADGFKGSVYLMPQGGVVTPYEANKVNIANICCAQGFYYSPRLHVDLWGNGWGK